MKERQLALPTLAQISHGRIGAGVGFHRIRRITGYLVGTIDRFNDAKRCEVAERVKHGCCGSGCK